MSDRKELDVDFELVSPSEPYFHIVRTLLTQYLDGEEQESLNISGMTDSILQRASIGSVIASSLGVADPVLNPEYAGLDDEEFAKIADKANATRDVYGVIHILSLTWSRKKENWLEQIYNYTVKKAEKYCKSETESNVLKTILSSKNVGLLVNERLVNMPADLVPSLHN